MASDLHRIVLSGVGHHDEGEADSTIYPGEAICLAADGKYDPETSTAAVAAGKGLKIAKEDSLQGKTVDDYYSDGDIVSFYIPVPGDRVQVLVKAGEDIDIGDNLAVEGSGSGKFVEVSSSSTAEYKLPLTSAKKHDDLSASLGASIAATPTATTTYPVPLTNAKIHDAMDDFLPDTAANDDMAIITGTPGTDAPTLQGVDFGGTTSDEKCAFELELPPDYIAGQSVTVRVRAAMLTTVADTSCTVDVEAFETDGDGAVGSDICATAAQSMNSLTPANLDFTITPTNLAPGDTIIVRLSFAGTDSGNLGVMVPEISALSLIVGTTAAVTAAASGDDMALITGTPGTDAPTLQGVDFGGTTSDEKCAFEFVVPQEYRAGAAITMRIKAGMLTTVADTSATIDVECWKDAGDGSVGSDICATAAQSINSLTMANKDFIITATGVVPGDRLVFRLSFAGTDSGDAGVMIPEIQNVALLIGNMIVGQMEALEDSGGALVAATLIKCRVLNP